MQVKEFLDDGVMELAGLYIVASFKTPDRIKLILNPKLNSLIARQLQKICCPTPIPFFFPTNIEFPNHHQSRPVSHRNTHPSQHLYRCMELAPLLPTSCMMRVIAHLMISRDGIEGVGSVLPFAGATARIRDGLEESSPWRKH